MATILKYKNYTWPCNPETCNVTMSHPVTLNKDSAGALSQTQTATEPRLEIVPTLSPAALIACGK